MQPIKLGIIGGGSMGGAIARGVVEAGVLPAASVLVADPNAEKRAGFEALGMRTLDDGEVLAAEAPDVVVLAVKPQVIGDVMAGIAGACAGRLVISIAAGVKVATIEAALSGARVVRVMPNLPVQVRSGATAVCAGSAATADDVALALELFGALGSAVLMSEAQLDVAGAVSGTAPAFFALFVDTLTRAAVKAGLPSAAARSMVEATMKGVATQLIDEGVHPRAYMERVTSPGGTTAAGLKALEPALLAGSYDAVDAALARTAELAGK